MQFFASVAVEARLRLREVCVCERVRRGQMMSGFHGFSLRFCVCVCVYAQRAMMRFSELELKEKEGGGVCVSASAAAAGRELADGQRRERALEHCQHTTRLGEREGE